jgi:hypothetical protein
VRLAASLSIVAILAACTAAPRDVPDLGTGAPDAGAPYGDLVAAWTVGGVTMTCDTVGAACGGVAEPCGPTEVLGPPDGVSFTIPPGGLLEVGFLCSHITDRPLERDLKLWATWAGENRTVIEVSYDGVEWRTLVPNSDMTDPDYELQDGGLQIARYVRVANSTSVAIELDAIEALR